MQVEIVESERKASEKQFNINENADIISEKVYKGDFDTKAMSVTDWENTSANDARAIRTNSLVNDAITEAGQQRWYNWFIDGTEASNHIEHFSKMVKAGICFSYQPEPFSA